MKLSALRSAGDVRALIEKVGLIPLFRGEVKGFSIEELTPEEFWFKEGVEGPWEWREELAASGDFAYGKIFSGKAGLIGLALYPQFCNMRREGYDFDARAEDGLAPDRERRLYRLVEGGVSLSHELRKAYGDKGYESALTRLQMRAYITVAGFDRRRDRYGVPYGWGISIYQTAEARFGALCSSAYEEDPEDSRAKIVEHLAKFISRADAERLIAYKG
jgi:hypothetical protein